MLLICFAGSSDLSHRGWLPLHNSAKIKSIDLMLYLPKIDHRDCCVLTWRAGRWCPVVHWKVGYMITDSAGSFGEARMGCALIRLCNVRGWETFPTVFYAHHRAIIFTNFELQVILDIRDEEIANSAWCSLNVLLTSGSLACPLLSGNPKCTTELALKYFHPA